MRAYRRREADSASDEARADRQADYRSKELQDSMVGKEESGHGFVYFIPPQGTPAFTDTTLRVRFVDAQEATSFVMELGLTGLGFKGTLAKSEAEKKPRRTTRPSSLALYPPRSVLRNVGGTAIVPVAATQVANTTQQHHAGAKGGDDKWHPRRVKRATPS